MEENIRQRLRNMPKRLIGADIGFAVGAVIAMADDVRYGFNANFPETIKQVAIGLTVGYYLGAIYDVSKEAIKYVRQRKQKRRENDRKNWGENVIAFRERDPREEERRNHHD